MRSYLQKMAAIKGLLVLGATIAISPVSLGREAWRIFESSEHFSVRYPADWRQIDTSGQNLFILSTGERAEGVIIASDEASIVVREIHDVISDDEFIERHDPDDELLVKKDIPTDSHTKDGCDSIKESMIRTEISPGHSESDQTNTIMLCRIGTRRFAANLTNWEDDHRQVAYQRIEKQIVQSIRPH